MIKLELFTYLHCNKIGEKSSCETSKRILEIYTKTHDDVVLLEWDARAPEIHPLVRKYKVTKIPTVVINEVERIEGQISLTLLENKIQKVKEILEAKEY